MNKWIKFISFLMASLFTVSAAHAGKENDTLVWVTKFEPPTYNYYDQTLREGVILSRHIWDSLYWRDLETGEFKPHLATKMEYSNPTTIDITLRKDIVFHNGEKFDADDVVFTINEIINPENKYKNRKLISWAKKAEKTGQYSVRLHLGKIFAPAMEMLSTAVVMYPDEYYKKVGKNGFARAPVGTGPYKAAEIVPGKHLALERNESYFGGAKGKAN
ncbi:ABC transporter substrate-binding protein, partial [Rhodospirillaceae bacterium]|nr:ABC transporter substrate-binding protein [Rhodospirillaceae bacterium]